MKFCYPAVFKKDGICEDKDVFFVNFPDIVGGTTEGYGMKNAVYMAKDLLRLLMSLNANNCRKAKPSKLEDVMADNPNDIVKMITVCVAKSKFEDISKN